MKKSRHKPTTTPWLERATNTAQSFREARIILSAIELDIFSTIGKSALSAQEIALRQKSDLRATRILLDALVGMRILLKRKGLYANTASGKRFLARQSDEYRGAFLVHIARFWEAWNELTQVVKSGRPARIESPANAAAFAWAMYDSGLERAREVAALVGATVPAKALDLGGGPGHYAAALADRFDECQIFLFDRPEMLEVAREIITANPALEPRIDLMAGDFLVDDIGSGYDLILASHIIHSYGEDDIRLIFNKASQALNSGGTLVIHDFLLEESMAHPPEAALFSVHMLLLTEAGRSYSAAETTRLLQAAGFAETRHVSVGNGGTSLLVARKS